MSGSRKIVIGVLLLLVAGGMALSPLGESIPGWIYGGVLLAMVVVLVLGVRRLNQQVDDLDSDVHSRRSTSVWLAGALSVRHGSSGVGAGGVGAGSSGELLAGPRGAERVAGKPANTPDGSGTGAG